MNIVIQLLSIFVLGLLGGVNPGPILTASFTEALRNGFIRSLRVIFMAMFAESIVAALILSLFFLVHIPQIIFYAISIVGAGVLVWLALQIWKIKELGGEGEIFSFWRLLLITILSGPFWIFWITICMPQAFLLGAQLSGGQILFLILFELGWLCSTAFLTFLFSRFRLLLIKNNFVPVVFKIFSLVLFFFAAGLIVQSVTFILHNL